MRRTVALIAFTALPFAVACGSDSSTSNPGGGTMVGTTGTTVDPCAESNLPTGAGAVAPGGTNTTMSGSTSSTATPGGTNSLPPVPRATAQGTTPERAGGNPCEQTGADPRGQAPVIQPGSGTTPGTGQMGQTDQTRAGDTGSGGSSSGPSSGEGGSTDSTSGSETDRPANNSVGRAPDGAN